MSRMKKCRRWTCFILSWCSELYETLRACARGLRIRGDGRPGSGSPRPAALGREMIEGKRMQERGNPFALSQSPI